MALSWIQKLTTSAYGNYDPASLSTKELHDFALNSWTEYLVDWKGSSLAFKHYLYINCIETEHNNSSALTYLPIIKPLSHKLKIIKFWLN